MIVTHIISQDASVSFEFTHAKQALAAEGHAIALMRPEELAEHWWYFDRDAAFGSLRSVGAPHDERLVREELGRGALLLAR